MKCKRLLAVILSLALLTASLVISASAEKNVEDLLKQAFENYVTTNGNDIVYGDVVTGVTAELAELTDTSFEITLAEEDFYIKHAVDGCIDEDTNEETRINIEGSDGAAAAIFDVDGTRIGVTAVIPHEVENLGELLIPEVSGYTDSDRIRISKIANTDTNAKYKLVIPKGYSGLNIYSGDFFEGGNGDNIVAIVMLDSEETLTQRYGTGGKFPNVKALVMSDNITGCAGTGNGTWVFADMANLKYVHMSENWQNWTGLGLFNGATALENINIPSGLTKFDANTFNATGLLEITYSSSVEVTDSAFTNPVKEGRNYNIIGEEMSFAKAAAYAASAAYGIEYSTTYTADSVASEILSDVVCTGLTTDWNDTFAYSEDNTALSGTLTLSNGTDTIPVSLSCSTTAVEAESEILEQAFENYVAANGNDIVYADVVDGVNAEVIKLTGGSIYDITLAEDDFYIKHAVDGCIDEDTNEETRINIEGSDGAITAVFQLGSNRIALSTVIPHTVENLGELLIPEVSGYTSNGVNIVNRVDNNDANAKYKLVIPEGYNCINPYGTTFTGGNSKNIVAIVMVGTEGVVTQRYGTGTDNDNSGKTFPNVKAIVMSDKITGFSQDWSFADMPSIKYVHMSEGWQGTTKTGTFCGASSLENINIPSGVTDIGYRSFEGTGLLEVTYSSSVTVDSTAFQKSESDTSCKEGLNLNVIGEEMSFAKAVSYVNSAAYSLDFDNYTEETLKAKLLEDIVCSGMETDVESLDYNEEGNTLSGTIVLSYGTDTVSIDFEAKNTAIDTAILNQAFKNYVAANGNDIVYADVVDGVNAEVSKLTGGISYDMTLAEDDFYIKHAVDGCIDEDTNAETRINIEGSDGAVTAIFKAGGVRYGFTAAIPHTVENLGELKIAGYETQTDDKGYVQMHKIIIEDSSAQYKIVIPEGVDYLTDADITIEGGSAENIVAIVMLDHKDTISKRYGTYGHFAYVKALVMSDNIVGVSSEESEYKYKDWWFGDWSSLKYMHMSEGWQGSTGTGFLCGASSLVNINIPEGLTEFGSRSFEGSGLLEVTYSSSVTVDSTAFRKSESDTSYKEGLNLNVIGEEMSFAKAVSYAQSVAYGLEYTLDDTAQSVADNILSDVVCTGLTTDWNDTFSYDEEEYIASGDLTLTKDNDSISVSFLYDFYANTEIPDMKYLGCDTTDSAIAVEISDVDGVTEVGCKIEITTADGTKTVSYSSDYINANAKGKKAWIAATDAVYYCDVDNNGVIEKAVDLTALRKLLLNDGTGKTANVNGDEVVDIRDLVRFKKILSYTELDFSDLAYNNYTYAFNTGDNLTQDGIVSITYKPYCVKNGLVFYGEAYEYVAAEETPIVKP